MQNQTFYFFFHVAHFSGLIRPWCSSADNHTFLRCKKIGHFSQPDQALIQCRQRWGSIFLHLSKPSSLSGPPELLPTWSGPDSVPVKMRVFFSKPLFSPALLATWSGPDWVPVNMREYFLHLSKPLSLSGPPALLITWSGLHGVPAKMRVFLHLSKPLSLSGPPALLATWSALNKIPHNLITPSSNPRFLNSPNWSAPSANPSWKEKKNLLPPTIFFYNTCSHIFFLLHPPKKKLTKTKSFFL